MFAKNKRLLWQFDEFKKMDGPSRWGVAKRLKFCYRCLKGTTEVTGGCQNTHNELLHGQLLTRNEATLYRQHQEPERGPVADISQSQTMGPILAQRGATVPG